MTLKTMTITNGKKSIAQLFNQFRIDNGSVLIYFSHFVHLSSSLSFHGIGSVRLFNSSRKRKLWKLGVFLNSL